MRFAISIPQLDTGAFDAPGVKSYLARAEELGFESGWTIEQTIGPTPIIAPLEMLAYAAACTERLRLCVGVLVSSQHDPVHLAEAITALDRLSHGRLEVGLSAGGGFRNFAAFGVDRDTFVSYFNEGLELMKAAWSDAAGDHLSRPLPRAHGRPARPEAGAAAASADLVRSCSAGVDHPRRAPRHRLSGRWIHADRQVRRAGAAGTRRNRKAAALGFPDR
jgi:alkanesulfonate monooxygenase SsuD/methylene tetrahydromethanopterin reductase-like flavin-dependent oxidoreductase (luciferase family)